MLASAKLSGRCSFDDMVDVLSACCEFVDSDSCRARLLAACFLSFTVLELLLNEPAHRQKGLAFGLPTKVSAHAERTTATERSRGRMNNHDRQEQQDRVFGALDLATAPIRAAKSMVQTVLIIVLLIAIGVG